MLKHILLAYDYAVYLVCPMLMFALSIFVLLLVVISNREAYARQSSPFLNC